MTTSTSVQISEASVRQLSEGLREPAWLLDRRLAALRAFNTMEMPDPREEEWRRTDISGFDLDAALAATGGGSVNYEIASRPANERFYFGDLAGALATHEDVIREHLHSLVLSAEWKLAALEAALFEQAALLYVPRGVEIEVPLRLRIEGGGGPLFPHLLVIAEENSGVTLVQEGTSADGGAQALVSGAVEIVCKADARVRFVDRQRWGHNVYAFSTIRACLERGAQLSASLVGLGGRVSKTRLDVQLVGEGASAELLGISYGGGRRHFDYQTLQDHQAPHTVSDLTFKSALDDESSNVWYGTVRIHKGASQSEASQTSRNLLLSDHAKAAPIPVLEIEAYDVLRCSHGAAAGPVDPEQLFYLESRGIPPAEAERLLVEAFFQEVIDRMPAEGVRDELSQEIAARIGAKR
jgi:Fe-S cluster assembly protein SufD